MRRQEPPPDHTSRSCGPPCKAIFVTIVRGPAHAPILRARLQSRARLCADWWRHPAQIYQSMLRGSASVRAARGDELDRHLRARGGRDGAAAAYPTSLPRVPVSRRLDEEVQRFTQSRPSGRRGKEYGSSERGSESD